MRNKVPVLVLTGFLTAASLHAEANTPGSLSTSGNKSPVINAGGDAVVNYGLNEEKLKAILQEREDALVKKLRAAAGDEQQSRLLEEQLQTVQAQKADIKKALEEEIQRRRNAEKALVELQGQLSPALIAKAKKSLEQGDTTAAEQVFDEVVDNEGKSVALAAYQSGQLAEGRVDYAKAMRQYKKAVALDEDNPDYLLAAGRMARILGKYTQALKYMELWPQAFNKNYNSIDSLSEACNMFYSFIHELRYLVCEYYFYNDLYRRYTGADAITLLDLEMETHPIMKNLDREVSRKYLDIIILFTLDLGANALVNNISWEESITGILNNLIIIDLLFTKTKTKEKELNSFKILLEDKQRSAVCILNNLALLYYLYGRYQEAESLLWYSIAFFKDTPNKDTSDLLKIFSNLGELYRLQGKNKKSRMIFIQITNEKISKKERLQLVVTAINLAYNLAVENNKKYIHKDQLVAFANLAGMYNLLITLTKGLAQEDSVVITTTMTKIYDLLEQYMKEQRYLIYITSAILKREITGQ